jgi:hypothetical protein
MDKLKRGLRAFWKSHVNYLNEPIGDENTDIFNLIQHLFTIEGEKQILKDKRGDNNVLEDVFMDDFKPYVSFDEFYTDFENLLVSCNLHDCPCGKCAQFRKFSENLSLFTCSKFKPSQRSHKSTLILHKRDDALIDIDFVPRSGASGNINKACPFVKIITRSNSDSTLITDIGRVIVYIMKYSVKTSVTSSELDEMMKTQYSDCNV